MKQALRFRLGLVGFAAGGLVACLAAFVNPVMLLLPFVGALAGTLLGSWLDLDSGAPVAAALATPFVALAVGLLVGALFGNSEDALGFAVVAVFVSLPWTAVVHSTVKKLALPDPPLVYPRPLPRRHPYRDPPC